MMGVKLKNRHGKIKSETKSFCRNKEPLQVRHGLRPNNRHKLRRRHKQRSVHAGKRDLKNKVKSLKSGKRKVW